MVEFANEMLVFTGVKKRFSEKSWVTARVQAIFTIPQIEQWSIDQNLNRPRARLLQNIGDEIHLYHRFFLAILFHKPMKWNQSLFYHLFFCVMEFQVSGFWGNVAQWCSLMFHITLDQQELFERMLPLEAAGYLEVNKQLVMLVSVPKTWGLWDFFPNGRTLWR